MFEDHRRPKTPKLQAGEIKHPQPEKHSNAKILSCRFNAGEKQDQEKLMKTNITRLISATSWIFACIFFALFLSAYYIAPILHADPEVLSFIGYAGMFGCAAAIGISDKITEINNKKSPKNI